MKPYQMLHRALNFAYKNKNADTKALTDYLLFWFCISSHIAEHLANKTIEILQGDHKHD